MTVVTPDLGLIVCQISVLCDRPKRHFGMMGQPRLCIFVLIIFRTIPSLLLILCSSGPGHILDSGSGPNLTNIRLIFTSWPLLD